MSAPEGTNKSTYTVINNSKSPKGSPPYNPLRPGSPRTQNVIASTDPVIVPGRIAEGQYREVGDTGGPAYVYSPHLNSANNVLRRQLAEEIPVESRIEYIPFQKKYVEYEQVERVYQVPVETEVIEYEEVVTNVPVAVERTVTEYFAVETQVEYIKREIEDIVMVEEPVERIIERVQYVPVETQIVHYPQKDSYKPPVQTKIRTEYVGQVESRAAIPKPNANIANGGNAVKLQSGARPGSGVGTYREVVVQQQPIGQTQTVYLQQQPGVRTETYQTYSQVPVGISGGNTYATGGNIYSTGNIYSNGNNYASGGNIYTSGYEGYEQGGQAYGSYPVYQSGYAQGGNGVSGGSGAKKGYATGGSGVRGSGVRSNGNSGVQSSVKQVKQ